MKGGIIMLAKDIMVQNVIVAGPDDNLEDVARILVENKISGLPVVDSENHVVGIITEKDLMIKATELQVPFYVTLFDSIIFLENPIRLNKELKKYTATRVGEIMTRKTLVVEEDAPMNKIVEIMQGNEVNRVPVVREGKLVGIITRNDILKALVKRNG